MLLVELVKLVIKGVRKQEILINYLQPLRLSNSENYRYNKHIDNNCRALECMAFQ